MTQDQVNSLVRSFVQTFGGAIGGYFLARGWFTQEQLSWLSANAPTILGIASAAGAAVWGWITHKPVNLVAAVAAMPEVSQVTTVNTLAGSDLAHAANAAAGPAGTVAVERKDNA